MRLGGPLIAANLLLTFLILISIIMVGHLGNLVFAGAALAISFAAVTGFSMLMGLGCALETLCGQAYGAKQYHMLGIQLQKAMLVLTLSSVPIAAVWLFADKVLIFLHQDSEISEKAGVYIRWMLPSLFAYGLVQCQIRFLQTQNLVMPLMLGAGSTAVIHGLTSWAFVYRTGIGYVGAALATSLSYWYMVVFLAVYIKFSPACKATWPGFSKEALRCVYSFIKLAVPMEYWSFEAIVILSGLLPNPKLETSTMSSCLSICTTLYMIPFGIGATISTRVSNELGARNPRAAKLAIFIILVIGTVEAMVLGMAIILMRNSWGQLVSKDKEVISHMASVMPLVAVVQIIDAYQCVFAGIVRGCGWQKICTVINLGSFYGVGLPISVLLAFKFRMGGKVSFLFFHFK
ncbi:MATE efflux family protein 5 [Platanthera guangdongensis]|uniref:MATE efflux family protein 5 n=1 Tax=Platanthera guangdongensis TaxID=2320717 RepID=A0ABR2LGW6_9ASPA